MDQPKPRSITGRTSKDRKGVKKESNANDVPQKEKA